MNGKKDLEHFQIANHIKSVIEYIENQELHHRKKTFLDEYLDFLQKFEVDYDEKYIFKELI